MPYNYNCIHCGVKKLEFPVLSEKYIEELTIRIYSLLCYAWDLII